MVWFAPVFEQNSLTRQRQAVIKGHDPLAHVSVDLLGDRVEAMGLEGQQLLLRHSFEKEDTEYARDRGVGSCGHPHRRLDEDARFLHTCHWIADTRRKSRPRHSDLERPSEV